MTPEFERDRFTDARIDLGCGLRKRAPDFIGIDVLDGPVVDIVGDALTILKTIPTGVVAEVYCSHFLEHIEDVPGMVSEIARVLRAGGELNVTVPHFSNPYFYSDPTHKTAFGLYSFAYLVPSSPFKRTVPTYGDPLPLQIATVRLGFKAARPFYFRHAIRRFFGAVVNVSRATQEFYEDILSGVVSCYEIEFRLVRI